MRGVVDAAYSLAVLGIVAYTIRGELRNALARTRADFDTRRREVEARTEQLRRGREYLGTIGPRIIAEEWREDAQGDDGGPFLGMEP